ncbi:MAG: thiamine pyrophosphate-binding protein, partial [Candidatus Bathyarchaeia archaeon]
MTGAQAVVGVLEREGVEAVFGHPGGANMPIYDVLYDHQNPREYKGILHIL